MSQDLEQVRAELRRLGYLNHRFERFLLQDALRPQGAAGMLPALAAKVALAGGWAVALAAALLLAAVNGNLQASPFDLAALFLHLLPLACLGLGGSFAVLAGALMVARRWLPARRIERLCLVLAVLTTGLAVVLVLRGVVTTPAQLTGWQLALLLAVPPPLLYVCIEVLYGGLLSLAIKLADRPPRQRTLAGGWIGAAVLLGLGLLVLPAVLAVRRPPPPAPLVLPAAPGQPVLVIGLDGVLPAELDYLLARRELPALAELLAAGALLADYRWAEQPPAVFWTSIATGLPGAEHGVTALDAFRPRGVATALAHNGPIRGWWRALEPMGLVEHRALLADRRRAFAFWELASRGGQPVAAVNWWSTFPAEPLPGLVVAHGAFQLLAEGAPGATAASGEVGLPEVSALAAALTAPDVAAGPFDAPLAALPAADRDALNRRALLPDRFYLQAFELALARQPRAAALYLPGPDLAADGWQGGALAYGDLVRAYLAQVDGLLARHGGDFGAVAVVLHPGRRRGAVAGRVMLGYPQGCPPPAAAAPPAPVAPEAVTAALLRVLGLPQSAELPPPPETCTWPAPPDRLESFGTRQPAATRAPADGEYLENLRSLGYL